MLYSHFVYHSVLTLFKNSLNNQSIEEEDNALKENFPEDPLCIFSPAKSQLERNIPWANKL